MGRRDLVTAFVLCALALGYFSLTATRTFDLKDEGYLLARSVQVAAGAVPHWDFSDVYGPGVFAAVGTALRLGGGEILAVRVLLMLLKALAVVAGFAVARQFAPPWAAVVSSLLAIAWWGRLSANLNTPYAALFTIPLALVALWLLIRAVQSERPLRFLAAGLVAGGTVLFKQSLGAMLVYGMLLGLAALALGGAFTAGSTAARSVGAGDGTPGGRAQRMAVIAVFLATATLPMLPVLHYLNPRDYLLHFLPLHALAGVAVLASWRRGGPPPLGSLVRDFVVPFGVPFTLGAVLAPLATVLAYAALGGWGAVSAMWDDMFRLPLSLANYDTPVALPPSSLLVSLAGVVMLATALLQALAPQVRGARVVTWASAGGLLLLLGRFGIPTDLPRLYTAEILVWRAPFALEGALLPGLLACGVLAAFVAARRDPARVPWKALAPLFFTMALLCFEVFPRAGHNLWILHGALAPLLAWVLSAWVALATSEREPAAAPIRFLAAIGIACVVPVWLVGPIVRTVVVPDEPSAERRAPALPRAGGLSLGLRQIQHQHIDDLEQLVRFLETTEPRDAPLLVMTNEAGIPLFSGRRDLFEDRAYQFFLAGWGMLSPADQAALDSEQTLDVLRRTKDVLVIHRADATAKNLRRALPRLRELIEGDFQIVARFGDYRVLRRADRATLPSRAPSG